MTKKHVICGTDILKLLDENDIRYECDAAFASLRFEHIDEYADANTERGQCMLKRICEIFGFDSMGYQSLEGVLESIGIDKDKVCTYCWTGKE